MNDSNNLADIKWSCKYYVVFGSNYQRQVFYGEKCLEITEILRTLCQ